jgi:hypothetical protein
VWLYDVVASRTALSEALHDLNFDNMRAAQAARAAGHPWALIGPGIDDHHFTTPEQLASLVAWLCSTVLGAYASWPPVPVDGAS